MSTSSPAPSVIIKSSKCRVPKRKRPDAGGQNEVDAAHPPATYVGFISIVVPDFAEPLFHDLRQAYVYEYLVGGRWRQLDAEEIQARFIVEEQVRRVIGRS